MGCFLAFFSRLALLLVWLLTPMVNRAFHGGWILPLLGIIFLPFTALTYALVYTIGNGVSGAAWLWVVLAFVIDLATHSVSVFANRPRLPRYRTA